MTVHEVRPKLLLQKKDDSSTKNLNETLLSRIRPFRGGSVAATLVALTGGETSSSKKDDGKAVKHI